MLYGFLACMGMSAAITAICSPMMQNRKEIAATFVIMTFVYFLSAVGLYLIFN